MMRSIKNRILFFLILLLSQSAISVAQDFSYIYIQGDKKTPIYTKVEGVMMPRYGKNYALISRLAPGPLNVEILFQQNEFPPLTFTILVPENGKRAFLLNRKGDEFSLFDLEQNFYLKPGNSESDDHLPTILNNKNIQAEIPEIPQEYTAQEKKNVGKKEVVIVPQDEIIEKEPKVIMPEKAIVSDEVSKPAFIEDITFNNDQNKTINSGRTSDVQVVSDGTSREVLNSDCRQKINQIAFQKLLNNINQKKTEDERLGVLLSSVKEHCFSTEQATELVQNLQSDIAKYSALKNLYPKITDQSNFATLETLIEDADWKASFRSLSQPK